MGLASRVIGLFRRISSAITRAIRWAIPPDPETEEEWKDAQW